jgi:hypothetical protein
MWVQEKPSGHIGIANAERWGTYLGNFFKRIEISDLLSRQALEQAASKIHHLRRCRMQVPLV